MTTLYKKVVVSLQKQDFQDDNKGDKKKKSNFLSYNVAIRKDAIVETINVRLWGKIN